jgi:hypothetical protein
LAGKLPVEEIKVADGRLIHSRVFLVDGGKLGRVGIRQRVEKHAIDNGKSAVFPPMPSARVAIIMAVNPGYLRSMRRA